MPEWTPQSWRSHDALKQPTFPDLVALNETIKHLGGLPPLIYAGEARNLTAELAAAARREAFVLQAGDCAETFAEFSADRVKNGLKVILQMAVVLTYSSGVPTVKIGRMAGQFAKPRSEDKETVAGEEMWSYLGDMINSAVPDQEARIPDPANILRAYEQSAMTLNLVRGFTHGGFADLSKVHQWNREFVASSPEGKRYEAFARGIDSALRFMQACKVDTNAMHEVDLYSSHEALFLPYEEALTRQDSMDNNSWYDCSAHMLWIGTRTKGLNDAHVHFLSGVGNPIGCKIDQDTDPDFLVDLCDRLDPEHQPGRLTLISRMGHAKVREHLPLLIKAVEATGHPVVWMCDPMHGNTITSSTGFKTRRFDDVYGEVAAYFEVHGELGTWPGGIHLELTGDNVTECLGGSDGLVDDELSVQYNTACDPRLNARQSLDLAFQVAELLEDFTKSKSKS